MIKDNASLVEKYGPILEIDCQVEADKYFEECVNHQLRMNPGFTRREAVEQEVFNINKFAISVNPEQQDAVRRLFGVSR